MPIDRIVPRAARRAWPAAVLTLLAATATAHASETRRIEKEFDLPTHGTVEIHNLAGAATVVPATGTRLRVVAVVHAEASAGRSASELAESITLERRERGSNLVLEARYPVDRHDHYHYPGRASSGSADGESSWLGNLVGAGSNRLTYLGSRVQVSRSAERDAATLWVDLRVEVPSGARVHLANSVGQIESTGVVATQSLDTGSGDVVVRDAQGDLVVDTGSGKVDVSGVVGETVSADTGSGNVTLAAVDSTSIDVDTGSGNVSLLDCRGSLDIDTGSGEIRGRGLGFGPRLLADTGSGDVRLAGDFSEVRDLRVDTGSGDVSLDVDGDLAVRLAVSTGSGSIDVTAGGTAASRARGSLTVTLGDGSGRGEISTGSGDVTVTDR